MEKQSKKKPSVDGSGESNVSDGNDEASARKYNGPPITDGWFAIVDLEDNSICNAAWCVADAREILSEEVLYEFKEDWRAEHPEYEDSGVPDEVLDEFNKRYIVVRCEIKVTPDEEVW